MDFSTCNDTPSVLENVSEIPFWSRIISMLTKVLKSAKREWAYLIRAVQERHFPRNNTSRNNSMLIHRAWNLFKRHQITDRRMIYWQHLRRIHVRKRWTWPKVVKLVKTQSKKNRLGHQRYSHRTSTSGHLVYKHPKEQDQVKDRFQTTNQIAARVARHHLLQSMKRETKFSVFLECPRINLLQSS